MGKPRVLKTKACRERRHKKCPYRPTYYGGKYTNCECFCHKEKKVPVKKVSSADAFLAFEENGKKWRKTFKAAGIHPVKMKKAQRKR